MKQIRIIPFILLFFFSFLTFSCLTTREPGMSRRDTRESLRDKQMDIVRKAIEDSSFVFVATHALPVRGGNIHLNYSYDVKIEGDTLISYLPYFGVAYHVEYGRRNSPLDLKQPMEKYQTEETKKGYIIKAETKNNMDYLTYTFHIPHPDNATLNVTSTNRQAISFYGRIKEIRDEEEVEVKE